MTNTLSLDRRGFIVGASTLGGGLALGMRLPFDAARAAETATSARGQRLGGDQAR